jgi:hypothetical protein
MKRNSSHSPKMKNQAVFKSGILGDHRTQPIMAVHLPGNIATRIPKHILGNPAVRHLAGGRS